MSWSPCARDQAHPCGKTRYTHSARTRNPRPFSRPGSCDGRSCERHRSRQPIRLTRLLRHPPRHTSFLEWSRQRSCSQGSRERPLSDSEHRTKRNPAPPRCGWGPPKSGLDPAPMIADTLFVVGSTRITEPSGASSVPRRTAIHTPSGWTAMSRGAMRATGRYPELNRRHDGVCRGVDSVDTAAVRCSVQHPHRSVPESKPRWAVEGLIESRADGDCRDDGVRSGVDTRHRVRRRVRDPHRSSPDRDTA